MASLSRFICACSSPPLITASPRLLTIRPRTVYVPVLGFHKSRRAAIISRAGYDYFDTI